MIGEVLANCIMSSLWDKNPSVLWNVSKWEYSGDDTKVVDTNLSIASTALVISSKAYITSASKSMMWRPFNEETQDKATYAMPEANLRFKETTIFLHCHPLNLMNCSSPA